MNLPNAGGDVVAVAVVVIGAIRRLILICVHRAGCTRRVQTNTHSHIDYDRECAKARNNLRAPHYILLACSAAQCSLCRAARAARAAHAALAHIRESTRALALACTYRKVATSRRGRTAMNLSAHTLYNRMQSAKILRCFALVFLVGVCVCGTGYFPLIKVNGALVRWYAIRALA